MKKILTAVTSGLVLLAVWLCPAKNANAIPAWSRKYNADCSMCHTANPRLNATGHKFRRMGYKMPADFDSKDVQFSSEELAKFTNFFGARGRPRILWSKAREATTNFDLQMHDVTLFYAGPVTRNFSFFFELPFEPETGAGELEVGQLLATFGNSDSFFTMRAGQFHQFSGVGSGALDRPIALTRPSVMTTRINGFRLQHDGAGAEVGYSNGDFTGLVQVNNGVTAAGTGSVLNNNDPNQAKDVGVLLEYLIPDHEASVSALYVFGKEPPPTSLTTPPLLVGQKHTIFNRFYLFAEYLLCR